ncbi:NAD(P)/FAD-dependent oxidoreductase [Amphibacillus jilinensis]|uniref:NAD(P)/FAD-dependent oxidoreductase n=1 Tax=Amphibacillus jilinensis TaxID=1216008 RepID=UPI000307F710|nr:NAD(P)/FAD-dependent oxidoreductase [Amphibacillus jilinensis]
MIFDCIIVGGGPAGLNAALVLGRARRKAIIFDDKQPRNFITHASHGFITRDGISPKGFRNLAQLDIDNYPSIERKDETIVSITPTDSTCFTLKTTDGQTYTSKTVILATGLKETLPNINGISDYYGESLFSCPYCNGWELRDQPLVLISEKQDAGHMAKLIYQWSKDLIVCTNGTNNLPKADEQSLKNKGIKIQKDQIINLVGAKGQLEKLIFKSGIELNRNGGFVSTDPKQPNALAVELGCQLNEDGGVVVDQLGRTNIDGIYAAGDRAIVNPAKLIIAAAHGVRAAMGVNSDLTTACFQ